jgi:hypothetical protein
MPDTLRNTWCGTSKFYVLKLNKPLQTTERNGVTNHFWNIYTEYCTTCQISNLKGTEDKGWPPALGMVRVHKPGGAEPIRVDTSPSSI